MLSYSPPIRLISLSITNPRPSLLVGSAAAATATATAVKRCWASSSSSNSFPDEHSLQVARTWLAQLHPETIPKSIGEVSFSRSSGPGGQNVNKVNSKATLKIPLGPLFQQVPSALHAEIRRSRYCAERSNTLIIQADDSRKQADNVHSCYRRLYETLVEAGRMAVPGQTSPEQARRVHDLQKSDNERRIRSKKHHSAKKSSRRGRPDD